MYLPARLVPHIVVIDHVTALTAKDPEMVASSYFGIVEFTL